jgi:hypothetical protein
MSGKSFFDWEGRSPEELLREQPQTDRVEARHARHRDHGGAVSRPVEHLIFGRDHEGDLDLLDTVTGEAHVQDTGGYL